MPRPSWLAAVAALAATSCHVGCDGHEHRAVEQPKPSPIVADAGTPDAAVAVEPPLPGYLDMPAGSLDGLFTGLAAAEHGDANGRALLLFFGDSHTAGDSLTSRLRTTLQAKFGDAGRGFVGAGRPPTRHYYQRDVKYGTIGSWRAMVGGHRGDTEPFGLGGIRVVGTQKGGQLWVSTCADCQAGTTITQFELFYYAAPDHGLLRYRIDDQPWQQLSTRTAAIEPPHPAQLVIPVPEGAHKLTMEHGGQGPLELFGVALERAHPGVIVDSVGVVGRRLGSLRSWDWSVIGEQLATRDPRLVVLQYGTNEADDPDLDLEALARYYDETILRIRAAAPTASILILGPPDLGVRDKGCDRVKPAPNTPPIPECLWHTPGVLTEIIAVEHAAAVRNKVAFFDTFAAMGGADQMGNWAANEPKVAYKDHTHFTDLGYGRWADALETALLAAYDRWKRAHR
jgi:lysophospholipase L1-like esterase